MMLERYLPQSFMDLCSFSICPEAKLKVSKNVIFVPFFPRGVKKCLFANKGCPEAVNLHMQLISDDKYYDNVHFRYTLIFDYFGAPLGVKRGSKRVKTCLFATKWYSEAVNLHMQHIAVENYYDNVHCLCKQFMNHWPRIIFIWHYSTYYCWNISRI